MNCIKRCTCCCACVHVYVCAQKEKYLVNHSCFSPSVPLGSRYGPLKNTRTTRVILLLSGLEHLASFMRKHTCSSEALSHREQTKAKMEKIQHLMLV